MPEKLDGQRGVISFMNIPTYAGQGHIDLWDGTRTVGPNSEYWDASPIWFWRLNYASMAKMARLAQMALGLILGVGCRSVESRPAQLGEVPATASEDISNEPPSATAGSTAAATPSSAANFTIAKSKDEVTGETKLRVAEEACDVEAVVKAEGSELIIVRHANCQLGADEYADVWRQVLASAIDEAGFVGSKIHLAWGRIAFPESDAMAPFDVASARQCCAE